jgi:sulfite exporter TauE/SafE
VVVAAIAVLLRESLPPIDMISAWSERFVGGSLIALGLWGLRKSAKLRSGSHAHSGLVHDHVHVQRGPTWIRRLGHVHASFCLGVLHGIAGTSHFFGVLPALALPTPSAALTYIAAFGVGTIVTMTAFALVIGWIGGVRRMHQSITVAAALMAIVVGGVWLSF